MGEEHHAHPAVSQFADDVVVSVAEEFRGQRAPVRRA